MEWELPDNFREMHVHERIEWHRKRIEKEDPIYVYLAKTRLLTTLHPEEVRERLEKTRARRKQVEAALLLYDNEEFNSLKTVLDNAVREARVNLNERARILALQFRRKSFKDQGNEKEVLEGLKKKSDQAIAQIKDCEVRIVEICRTFKIDPTQYIRSTEIQK